MNGIPPAVVIDDQGTVHKFHFQRRREKTLFESCVQKACHVRKRGTLAKNDYTKIAAWIRNIYGLVYAGNKHKRPVQQPKPEFFVTIEQVMRSS